MHLNMPLQWLLEHVEIPAGVEHVALADLETSQPADITITNPDHAPGDPPPAGEPFSGRVPVIAQGNKVVATLPAPDGLGEPLASAVVPSVFIDTTAEVVMKVLSRLQDRHSLELNLETDTNPALPNIRIGDPQDDEKAPVAALVAGPASLKLYGRMDPAKGAQVGEIFSLTPSDAYHYGFEVDFDNLVDVPAYVVSDLTRSPHSQLYHYWFPEADVYTKARMAGLHREDYVRRGLMRAARGRGYDGIRYGELGVQLLD
jgi:hypothetical protein